MITKSLLPGLLSRDRDIDEESDDLMINSGAPDVDLSGESQNNTVTQNTSETHISRTDILNTLYNKNDSSEEEKNTIYTNQICCCMNPQSKYQKIIIPKTRILVETSQLHLKL